MQAFRLTSHENENNEREDNKKGDKHMLLSISSTMRYLLEFTKVFLVVRYLLDISPRKNLTWLVALSSLFVTFFPRLVDSSAHGILYAVLIFVLFGFSLDKKTNIFSVILSYISLSILDMIFSILCIHFCKITMEQILEDSILVLSINSISLVLILLCLFVKKSLHWKIENLGSNVFFLIAILGGLPISVFLTYIQLVELEYHFDFQNGIITVSFFLTIFYFITLALLVGMESKNKCLTRETAFRSKLLHTQGRYYSSLLKKEEETKLFRHDIRSHLLCANDLCSQKKYEELSAYLAQLGANSRQLSPEMVTGNTYTDFVLLDMKERFPDVCIEWLGKVPVLQIPPMDICTLFYNLLENAFEAASHLSEKIVKVSVKVHETNLLIKVSNGYQELSIGENTTYKTTKKERGHGYGIKNIKNCVIKHNGMYRVDISINQFRTVIMLPDAVVLDDF